MDTHTGGRALLVAACCLVSCGYLELEDAPTVTVDLGRAGSDAEPGDAEPGDAEPGDAESNRDASIDAGLLGGELELELSVLFVGSRAIALRASASEGATLDLRILDEAPSRPESVPFSDDARSLTNGAVESITSLPPAAQLYALVRARRGAEERLALAPFETDPEFEAQTIPSESGELAVLVVHPRERREALVPTVLFLHGFGARLSDGTDLDGFRDQDGLARLVSEAGDDFPYLLVAPRCRDDTMNCFNWGPTATLIEALDAGLATGRGDRSRVLVTGLSTGGGGALRLASEFPERFAAVVSIASTQNTAALTRIDAPTCALVNTPVWLFHAAEDSLQRADNSRAYADAYARCAPPRPATLSLGDWTNGGNNHTGWDEVYGGTHGFSADGFDSIWAWAFAP